MKALMVNDLCKTYITNKKSNNVLRNINFEVEEGEMVAIMGPSGSGKTTLLYTISGMDQMTAGSVEFFGQELCNLSQNEISDVRLGKMGFVFQQMYMLKNLTIYDNIVLPAYQMKKEKKDKKEINERAVMLMKKLGISEIADNDITEVSGGQLQRACICRSLMNHPSIIFADEPTGALNQQTSKEVMTEFNKINQEGTTIMMVTHSVKVATQSDRIIYIEDGEIKGDYRLGKYTGEENIREREKKLSSWLTEMGW
jgi:putative ABC transport system ATP-binding protein